MVTGEQLDCLVASNPYTWQGCAGLLRENCLPLRMLVGRKSDEAETGALSNYLHPGTEVALRGRC